MIKFKVYETIYETTIVGFVNMMNDFRYMVEQVGGDWEQFVKLNVSILKTDSMVLVNE